MIKFETILKESEDWLELFLELSNPENSYLYNEVSKNEWVFKDKYGNVLGCVYHDDIRFFETY